MQNCLKRTKINKKEAGDGPFEISKSRPALKCLSCHVKMVTRLLHNINVVVSVIRLGEFLNFLVTIFLSKVVQTFGGYLSDFDHLLSKNCFGYFLGNFWKHCGYFLFKHRGFESCSDG